METAYLALKGFVKSPLQLREWGSVLGRFDVKGWLTPIVAVVTLGLVLSEVLFGGGSFITGQSKDIQALQGQYHEMATQMESLRLQVAPLTQVPTLLQRLTDRLDAAPRADLLESRLTEIQRHLSALDGRGDATETRMRADEDRAVRDDARIDAIEGSSRPKLGNGR